jgi:hypothetical protein
MFLVGRGELAVALALPAGVILGRDCPERRAE